MLWPLALAFRLIKATLCFVVPPILEHPRYFLRNVFYAIMFHFLLVEPLIFLFFTPGGDFTIAGADFSPSSESSRRVDE